MEPQQIDGGQNRVRKRPGALALAFGCLMFLMSSVAAAKPVNLDLVDADVRMVLATVAQMGEVGLVLDDSVKGTITIFLDGVEPEEAFATIAAAKNLSLGETDGAVIITASRTGVQGLYRPYVFPVRYADLDTVCRAVEMSLMPYDRNRTGYGTRRESIGTKPEENSGSTVKTWDNQTGIRDDERRVLADPSTGSIVLYGTASEAKAAETLIAALDRPAPQVSLETKVLAITKEAAKELGVEWEWSRVPQYPDYTTDYETRTRTVRNSDGTTTTITEEVPRTTVRRSWDGSGSSMPGIFRFGRGPEGYPFEFYYGAKINALITDGKASLLSRPNITTLQGREAVINIGGEVPVQKVSVTNSTTTTSVDYRDAGIILRCTPRVGPDGYITAKVHTEVSSPHYVDALAAYRFNKRSADTEVRLRDGETMVIGGLIGSEESKVVSKVPLLGDLPLLGFLFRNVRTSKSDSEILIFLTAKVVPDPGNE